jgi:Ca2+-binding EF-hand superfamily protein
MSVTSRGTMREKLMMSFKMFDIDKNNVIDKKELEKLILVIYDLTGEIDRKGLNHPTIKVISIMNKLGMLT